MVKSYLKEEERIAEKIQKFSCLYDKGNTKDINKIRKKTRDVKFSLLNEIQLTLVLANPEGTEQFSSL